MTFLLVSVLRDEGYSVWFYISFGCMKPSRNLSLVTVSYLSTVSLVPTSLSFDFWCTPHVFTIPMDLPRSLSPLNSLPTCRVRTVSGDPRIDFQWDIDGVCKLDRFSRRVSHPSLSRSRSLFGSSKTRTSSTPPHAGIEGYGVPRGRGRFIEIRVDCRPGPLSLRLERRPDPV